MTFNNKIINDKILVTYDDDKITKTKECVCI